MKRHTTLWSCAAIILIAGSYGCADDALDLTKPTVRTQVSTAASQSANTERSALTTLTRAVALSLANDAFRAEVLQQMRDAPFKEHKLELRKFLNPGRLARLSSTSGKSASQLASALQTARALEFYMPIQSQREAWTGDANLLVASQLDDGEEIVGFDLKGRQVPLTEQFPPVVPTLTIVPVETRFDKPLDVKKSQNINDRGGKAIGTLVRCDEVPSACASIIGNRDLSIRSVIECGDCGGGGGSSYSGRAGLYMTFSRLVDMGEPWSKGDPEIEVHIHGPVSGGNPRYGEDLACAGEHASELRIFDQDNAFWNGKVLLFDKYQVEAFNTEFFDGHHILFWEDDDGPCMLKFESDVLRSAIGATISLAGGAAVKILTKSGWAGVISAFTGVAYNAINWLSSNDDYLGAAVPSSSTGHNWSDANYTILKGGEVNGRANIVWQFD
jgi:hypothetical protein